MFRNEGTKKILVCVDSYENASMKGRVGFAEGDTEIGFDSLMDLLLTIEDKLEQTKIPQAYLKMRGFSKGSAYTCNHEKKRKICRGAIATFSVKILFRQNASWQGYVSLVDTGQEESFRSALELIFLMNSALT